MVLEPIFEGDFHPDSYGFRPGRSAHQALAVLDRRLMQMGGGWVLELDIRAYFDTIDHSQLRSMLRQRVSDGVILRLIGQWLNAGVMEAGHWYRPDRGSPQGGVISPLLANLYLHHVLDQWFAREVQPRLIGCSHLLRYADDAVLGFANEHDARRVQAVLAQRFARFGLTLHPTKTRLVYFRPPVRGRRCESFEWLAELGQGGPAHAPLCAAHASHPSRCRRLANPATRGAGCGSTARPDRWGAGRATGRSTRPIQHDLSLR